MPAPTTLPDALPLPWVGAKLSTNLAGGSYLALVSLRDLVLWLMQSKGINFVGAARELHGALHGCADLRLYIKDKSGLARIVGAVDTFGLVPVQRRIYSRGIGAGPSAPPSPASLPDGVTPGASAALYYIEKMWGGGHWTESSFDDGSNPASCLAMPCDQAAAIWGNEADTQQTKDPVKAMTKEDSRLLLLEQYEVRKGTRAQFAKEHGISVFKLKKILTQACAKKKEDAANPYKSLSVIGGKK